MIPQTVLNVLAHYKRRSPDAHYVLAVSGGLDSLALLHICTQLGAEHDFPLHVATLDHGLRGQAGADDAAFVVETARRLRLPATMHTVDTLAFATEHQIGIELAARRLRYDFLATVAQQFNHGVVVTAHHADDQAESILMHIVRGAGLRGLRGMEPISQVPGHADVALLRPLLTISRAQLESYGQQHGLSPREDATNDDTTYTRNALRHRIMPELRAINPRVEQALSQLADAAAVDSDYLSAAFDRDVWPHCRYEDGRFFVEQVRFAGWHGAIQRRAIMRCMQQLAPDADISHERIMAAIEVALRAQVGQISEFSEGWRLRVGYDDLIFEHSAASLPLSGYAQLEADVDVPMNGRTRISEGVYLHTQTNSTADDNTICVPSGKQLTLRGRLPGDVLTLSDPIGDNGVKHRKLKKWLIDRKVPQHVRDRLPILCIDDHIVAILLPDGWYYLAMPYDTQFEGDQVSIWLGNT